MYPKPCLLLGGWFGNVLVIGDLRSFGALVYVLTLGDHQNNLGEMDHGVLNVLLLHLHRSPILSVIWDLDPRGHYFGTGCGPNVECQMYLFDSSEFVEPIHKNSFFPSY